MEERVSFLDNVWTKYPANGERDAFVAEAVPEVQILIGRELVASWPPVSELVVRAAGPFLGARLGEQGLWGNSRSTVDQVRVWEPRFQR